MSSISELLIMKEGLYAAMLVPYGDLSHFVSREYLNTVHFNVYYNHLLVLTLHLFISVGSWSGGHIKWGQFFRIRHITTGRYLCLDEEKGLLLVDPEKANSKLSAFCFRISKVIVMQSHWPQKSQNCLSCLDESNIFFILTTGKNRSDQEARCGRHGHAWDKVWRVHVLRAACLNWPLAHICCCRCQICPSGSSKEKGKAELYDKIILSPTEMTQKATSDALS